MKVQADKKRTEVEFKEGEIVYLKLKPYRQQSLARRKFEKLAARYYGPYKVLQKVGKVAYNLELPPTASIHPVFHVSLLRPAFGSPLQPTTLPDQLSTGMEMRVQPAAVLGTRTRQVEGQEELKVLIQWLGLPAMEATWEDFKKMEAQFPEFHIGDKVKLGAAGNDSTQTFKVYQRRGRGAKAPIRPMGE
ncbi:hypothetical protein LXL04_037076 [Taraxacum kok-saghyz]